MKTGIWLIALVGTNIVVPAARAQFGHTRVARPDPQPQVGEPTPQPTASPPQTAPATPGPAVSESSRTARPQSLEQQVTDLQAAVSALQTQVEQLTATINRLQPPDRDHYLASRSPGNGITCEGGSLLSLNDVIQRTRADADDRAILGGSRVNYYRPPRMVWTYDTCHLSGQLIGDPQVGDGAR